MPMCSTLRRGRPVEPAIAPERTPSTKACIAARPRSTSLETGSPCAAKDAPSGARRAGCSTARPSGAVHRLPAEQPRPGRLDLAGPRQVQGGVEALKAPGLLGQVQVQASGVGAQALKARCAFCLKQVDQPAAIFARGGL
jgi:hypothetical protein